jgi:protein-tyrosine phosphatase
VTGRTCFHNHLVPGVDDGARDEAYSAGALAAFRREGVTRLITTPHFDGSLSQQPERLAARLAELDAGWARLRAVVDADAAQFGSALRVERGVEIMLDVPDPVLDDPRLRLAGTHFVLVEYPMLQLPPVNAAVAVGHLRRAGWIPVVAHPERYRNLESLAPLREFLAAGAVLQVNAGSIFGDYGSSAQARAHEILAHGLASYVCSDYHARGEPGTARFARALAEAGFGEQAELLVGVNPGRVLGDQAPLTVPPITSARPAARSWWRRLLGPRRRA